MDVLRSHNTRTAYTHPDNLNTPIIHHDTSYLPGGDLFILIDNTLFCEILDTIEIDSAASLVEMQNPIEIESAASLVEIQNPIEIGSAACLLEIQNPITIGSAASLVEM